MLCASCANDISNAAVFCPHCGAQVEGREECRDYMYEAFISYRHRDADRAVAKRLQRYLENFKIPKRLEAERSGKRLGKLFRDEDELPTSGSLSEQIEQALLHSRYLIVACSPQSLGSLWVQREVELYASLHGRKRIFLAMVEGEPEESFPPLLLQRIEVASDGTQTLVDEEPLAADFRRVSGKKFKSEAARIAAAIIGCGYDDLQQRLRVRKMQAIATAAGIVAAVSLAFGAFSYYQQTQIEKEHRKAQIHESELLAVESEKLLASGDRYQAIQVALSALPESSEHHDRPFVPAAQLALERAIGAYPSQNYWTSDFSMPLTSDAPFATSEYGAVATLGGDESITMVDPYFGRVMLSVDKESLLGDDDSPDVACGGISFSDWGLVCGYGDSVYCLDPVDGGVVWRVDGKSPCLDIASGEKVVSVLFAGDDSSSGGVKPAIVMYDASNGDVLQEYPLDRIQLDVGHMLQANDSGDTAVLSVADSHEAFLFDTQGNGQRVSVSGGVAENVCYAPDATYIMSGDGSDFGPMIVEAFDSSFKRTWSYESDAAYSFGVDGSTDAAHNKICYIEQNGTVMVSLSTALVELDAETGTQLNRTVFNKPILDFSFEDPLYFGILSDGQIFWQDSLFTDSGIYYEDLTTLDLCEAEFLRCDGVGYFVLGRSIAPEKLTSFRMGDGFVADMTREAAEVVPRGSKVYWEYERPCSVGEAGLSFLDAETFEPLTTVDRSELSLLDWDNVPYVSFADDGEVLVWGFEQSSANDIALYRVSEEGEVLGATTLEGVLSDSGKGPIEDLSSELLTITGDGSILWRSSDRVLLLDCDSLSIAKEYAAREGGTIDDVCCGASTVLVFEHDSRGGTRGSFRLLDRETGERIASELDDYSYYTAKGVYSNLRTGFYRIYVSSGFETAVSPDAKRVAIACSDGATRVFDLDDGRMEWESWAVPPQPVFIAFVPDTNKMVVQDERGICSLVSADDGALLASSVTSLPPMQDCLWAKGSSILVRYRESGARDIGGLAVLSVLEEGFGPYMDIPKGVALTKGFDDVLTQDADTFSFYPTVILDESLNVAKKLVEDHPLTEAEAAYYQVDQ